MEIETALRKHLVQQKTVTNLVARERIWKFTMEESVEGTGKVAVVFYRKGSWKKPGMNSQEYPLIVIDVYADHSRDEQGDQLKDDRDDRAYAVWRELDRVLHQVDREVRHWPVDDPDNGLLVLGCYRGSDPQPPVVKHGVAMVRSTYDVQVIHSG